MIKVIGYSKEKANHSVVYNKSARVLDIESSSMCDDCIPYDESTACMVWLDKNHILCELECIYPTETDNLGSCINQMVQIVVATPVLKIKNEEKAVEVFVSDTELVLILNKYKKADKKYISKDLAFYVSGDEVVAIESTNFQVV